MPIISATWIAVVDHVLDYTGMLGRAAGNTEIFYGSLKHLCKFAGTCVRREKDASASQDLPKNWDITGDHPLTRLHRFNYRQAKTFSKTSLDDIITRAVNLTKRLV